MIFGRSDIREECEELEKACNFYKHAMMQFSYLGSFVIYDYKCICDKCAKIFSIAPFFTTPFMWLEHSHKKEKRKVPTCECVVNLADMPSSNIVWSYEMMWLLCTQWIKEGLLFHYSKWRAKKSKANRNSGANWQKDCMWHFQWCGASKWKQ